MLLLCNSRVLDFDLGVSGVGNPSIKEAEGSQQEGDRDPQEENVDKGRSL